MWRDTTKVRLEIEELAIELKELLAHKPIGNPIRRAQLTKLLIHFDRALQVLREIEEKEDKQ